MVRNPPGVDRSWIKKVVLRRVLHQASSTHCWPAPVKTESRVKKFQDASCDSFANLQRILLIKSTERTQGREAETERAGAGQAGVCTQTKNMNIENLYRNE